MMAEVHHLWKNRLSGTNRGYKKTITNLMLFLDGLPDLGTRLCWNELAQRVEWNREPIDDGHLVDIRVLLEAEGFEPNVNDLLPAVVRHAKKHAYHPVRDYLDGLKWDGRPRLDLWLHLCLGAPNTQFNRLVGRRTLIAAVARAYKPGCKVDTVLVLEGPQGIKKSSAIATLFGEDWTAESVNLFDQHNKMVMAMMGSWVVELAEFIAIAKRDQNTVKGMLSMRSDRVVLPYAKMATDHPRQCIFFGTINPGEMGYLTDSTGNRRYWPVEVVQADLKLIERQRDQLWAEALAAYRDGERWWLDAEEQKLAERETGDREEYDVWDEILADKISMHQTMTIAKALYELGVPHERMDKRAQMRASASLKRLGFVQDASPSKVSDGSGRRRSVRIFRRKPDG